MFNLPSSPTVSSQSSKPQASKRGMHTSVSTDANTKFIPFDITAEIEAARKALIRMASSIPTGSPLALFISTYCSHLTLPLPSFTQLLATQPPQVIPSSTHVLSNSGSCVGSSPPQVPGVYLFTDGNESYFGTALSLSTRLAQHITTYNTVVRKANREGIEPRFSSSGGLYRSV